mmetsp:Transcript_37693/g.87010  ORF Transcript_37693/g.87010 Transcript_37693/m.87010 type:complete len:346 (+) Transcript_37693:160-1197(+)|eukprot:CAMPEP_0182567678 /NCGR_PEP_ID=MMETSP1324-20130603/8827_1 /TAXON_ID=236786 /ORGANISM="Florenciella sp., Strain RCC1587" /LENGTH=345 /DNA_ID=CAMNT_0024781707 /DNA_START=114 /DNA_END=1151 /DNA_ORIENTATION=+
MAIRSHSDEAAVAGSRPRMQGGKDEAGEAVVSRKRLRGIMGVGVEALAGASAGAATDAVLYGIDSYKTQLQAGALKGNKIDPRKLFKGVGTVALCGSAPAFGFFFGVYEPFKHLIEDRFRCDPTVAVLGASVAGAVPASIIGVPTDVIKKRLVLGLAETPMGAARQVIAERGGVRGLFIGWEANLLKDVPFAAFKLSLYEGLMRFYLYMTPRPNSTVQAWESSAIGVASGMVTAVVTNPLDVINTRVKAAQAPAAATTGSGEAGAGAAMAARSEVRIASIARNLVKNEGYGALLSGLGPRLLILGFGSGLFWGAYGFAKTSWFRVALMADRQMWQGEDEGSSSGS